VGPAIGIHAPIDPSGFPLLEFSNSPNGLGADLSVFGYFGLLGRVPPDVEEQLHAKDVRNRVRATVADGSLDIHLLCS
jgi:hypothetical protein